MKKLTTLFLIFAALFSFQILPVQASSVGLSLSSTGEGDNVQLIASGDPSSNVLLLFTKTSGTSYIQYLGTTNSSGSYSTTISTAELGVASGYPVQVKVNNQLSNTVNWPYDSVTNSGAITLSQTGLILTVGGSTNLSINNVGSNKLYLLNNTNPQIANVSLSGSQATIYANSYGQTVATVCVLGTTSNCASTYITVQNSGAKALTLSQSNLTIAYGQSSDISILNSTGNYTILNNSNPNVITASINAQTITLKASNNGGSAAITVCSTDMSACGIINASVGSVSSSSLTFNQSNPTLLIGQSLAVSILGSGSNYNISSNSNSSIVNAYISGSTLNLVGNSTGSSVVTVCSSAGNCNSITATVSYASTGGPLSLNQSNLWLQVGQAASVVISGGTAPYSFLNDTNSASYFTTSLNNNILTLTGIAAGSANLSVCSAGSACTQLSVLVNGVSATTQLTFGNNNLNLKVGATSDVTLYGAGGYYISNSINQNVATVTVSGNKATVKALSAGSANVTVCQTGGQCGIIYISVTSSDSVTPISFSSSNPVISVGQNLNVSVSGGSNNTYYISSNSNPAVTQASISGNILKLAGILNGSSVVTICSSSNNCNSLAVTVNSTTTTTPTATTTTPTTSSSDLVIKNITDEANLIFNGDINSIISNVGATKNATLEANYLTRFTNPLIKGLNLDSKTINNINYFIVYGTKNTLTLGAGERAGVLGSYFNAYGKLPTTASEWSDLIKISVGRWPSELNSTAENKAKAEFKKIYDRSPVLTNQKDLNAVTIIAYGLRPTSRNSNSEKAAIKSFRYVYGHDPINSLAWNIVRAIAYSGTSK